MSVINPESDVWQHIKASAARVTLCPLRMLMFYYFSLATDSGLLHRSATPDSVRCHLV